MANTSTNTKNATADSATESERLRQVFETFKALRLKTDLLKGIADYGYVKPCEVHLQTIVPLCGKSDVFAKVAEFEPGRISAICIGILQKLDCASPKCQAVVFAASKFSSQVIGKAMEQLGAYLKVKVYVCDGSKGDCPDDVHVVVGKAMYVMDEWSAWKEHIKVVFFDKPSWQSSLEIAYIFEELLPSREKYHVCCFLERESMEVKTFKRVWMKEPVIIRVPHTLVLDKGKRRHRVISVTDVESKLCEIIHIYERSTKKTSVVFADSPKSVETLIKKMNAYGLEEVLPTTVGMKQKDRDKMTQELLQAEARGRVLITTIEWANDIDLKQVELVVNYDLPHPVLEDYLHRMCRFAVDVDVINLVTGDEWFILFDIQQQYKNEVIFEAFYPDLRGPAGFPVPPVERVETSEDKKLSPGIKHILYNVSTDRLKLSNIYEYLKEDLVKMKIVIFAKVDHSAVLKREGFNVHKMDDLKGFFQCKEDYCILLITEDKDALNNAHPKAPVVINFDLPSAPEIYNHRVAWCKTNGITMHFVTKNDWLKVFHFQGPQSESIIGWPPSLVTDFSSMIRKARRGSSDSYDKFAWRRQVRETWEDLKETEETEVLD